MTDYTELKRLAEACGDLNWRAIQENWCEWAIRDDHGYIATMRTKSAKHTGPCPDRESKAKFLCAVTPAAVLALIAENERLQGCEEVLRQLASYCGCGGYNAPEVDPEVFAKKIMDGINILNDPLVQLAERRAAERDQLRAEVAGLRTGYEAYEQVVQGLKAEVERHRAYADKCESAAAGFSRQLQAALIEIKALQGEKAAQGAIRKERQAEGIEKARAEGKYQGRPIDADLHARVIGLLQSGHGVRPTARLAECSTTTVIRIKAAMSKAVQP